MPRVAEKPKVKFVAVRLPEDEYARFLALADHHSRTVSSALQVLIRQAITDNALPNPRKATAS